jgi:hypothetical protein
MEERVHQKTNGSENCLVKALTYLVHHNMSSGGTKVHLICDYHANNELHSIMSVDIITGVRNATKLVLQINKQCIDPDLIGTYSLHAGCVMALCLHRYKDTVIMKMGHCTLLTFLQYIHMQIAHLVIVISHKMSIVFQGSITKGTSTIESIY